MHFITSAVCLSFIFHAASPLIHVGLGAAGGAIGAATGLGRAISDGVASGLGGTIGGGARAGIGGAANLIGGAEAAVQRLIHGGKRHNDDSDEYSDEFDFSFSINEEEYQDHNGKNGHGIHKHSGIGSDGGIRNNLLGLTQAVCKVSNAGEILIERLGELQLLWQEELKRFDRNIVNYITNNIAFRALDLVKKLYLASVEGAINAHILHDRLIINTIVLAYRVTKAPIRELFACY